MVYDAAESRLVNEFFIKLIAGPHAGMILTDGHNLAKIIQVFSLIYDTVLASPKVSQSITLILKKLAETEKIKTVIDAEFNKMGEK